MDLASAVRYLDSHTNLEARAGRIRGLSLDAIGRLMEVMADPHRAYRSIHVTGTNGKGSVARMISSMLVESGLSVGTYTSPHLQRLNERMTLNLEPIGDDELAEAITDVARMEPLAKIEASWFEAVTAAALSWFAEKAVDVAVVEVGLLGRFDATNVIDPDVAVITNVGADHTDGTGNWRVDIAREKAGIIKPGSMVVAGLVDDDVRAVIEDEVATIGAPGLWVAGEDFDVERDRLAVGGRLLDIATPGGVIDDVFIPAYGRHQAENAAVAVAATEAFFARPLEPEIAQSGLAAVTLPGRFEIVGHDPLIVLDGAHNPPGAEVVAETIEESFGATGSVIFVVGMLAPHDPAVMLESLGAETSALVIACAPKSPRAVPAEQVAHAARAMGVPVEIVADVADAVTRARVVADDDDIVVVTGSLYVVGEARTALGVG